MRPDIRHHVTDDEPRVAGGAIAKLPDRTNLNLFGSADVRLFKGFSFNVFGNYSRIRDQIGLKRGSASNEDVLLRLRQIESGYSYFVGFGVSYSFGSIFNSVVNPRYGGGGGGMMFFF